MKHSGKTSKFLLDILYPPKCMFCKRDLHSYDKYKVCAKCISSLPYTANNGCFETFGGAAYLISPLFYKDGVKTAIKDLKFRSKYENAALLSHLMINCIKNNSEAMHADVITCVPLSKSSLLKRGFNQTELLAKPISTALGIKYAPDLLTKVRETKRQSSLTTLSERAENIAGAYKCNAKLDGKTVLLADDVYTSGMTMYHCSNELLRCGAKKVIALTCANAHKDTGVSLHDYKAAHILFSNT